MCVGVCLSVSVCMCLSISLRVCVCVSLSVCLYVMCVCVRGLYTWTCYSRNNSLFSPTIRNPAGDFLPAPDCGARGFLPHLRPDLDHTGEDPVCGGLQPSHRPRQEAPLTQVHGLRQAVVAYPGRKVFVKQCFLACCVQLHQFPHTCEITRKGHI